MHTLLQRTSITPLRGAGTPFEGRLIWKVMTKVRNSRLGVPGAVDPSSQRSPGDLPYLGISRNY